MNRRAETLTPTLCRAGRVLLTWTQRELATRAQTAISTVADFERGARTPHLRSLEAIKAALEANGVRFESGRVSLSLSDDIATHLQSGAMLTDRGPFPDKLPPSTLPPAFLAGLRSGLMAVEITVEASGELLVIRVGDLFDGLGDAAVEYLVRLYLNDQGFVQQLVDNIAPFMSQAELARLAKVVRARHPSPH